VHTASRGNHRLQEGRRWKTEVEPIDRAEDYGVCGRAKTEGKAGHVGRQPVRVEFGLGGPRGRSPSFWARGYPVWRVETVAWRGAISAPNRFSRSCAHRPGPGSAPTADCQGCSRPVGGPVRSVDTSLKQGLPRVGPGLEQAMLLKASPQPSGSEASSRGRIPTAQRIRGRRPGPAVWR
jgi:hypothetical protein